MMTIRLNFLLLFTFISGLFLFNDSYAEDIPYCDPDSAQNDNLRRCAYQSLNGADKDLNATYQRVIKQLSSSEQIQLKKSERLWIKRKEQECYSPKALEGAGTTTDIDCGIDKTVNRNDYLTMYETCYHQDKAIDMMQKCLLTQYQRLDTKLNQTYKKTLKNLLPKGLLEQKKQEIQWIKQKEKTCNQYKKLGSNSLAVIECQIEQTQEQISVLEFQLGE